MAPHDVTLIVGSTFLMALTMRLCFSEYWFAIMWPTCQKPYISLPMHQRRTLERLGMAVGRAQFSHRRVSRAVYVLHFLSRGVVVAVSAVDCRMGFGVRSLQNSKNSWRPTSFESLLQEQALSRSPRPSRQSYEETKLPPRPFGHGISGVLEQFTIPGWKP